MEIVSQSYELCVKTHFKDIIQGPNTLDPSLKLFLPEALGKLGRYYSICCDLIDVPQQTPPTFHAYIDKRLGAFRRSFRLREPCFF